MTQSDHLNSVDEIVALTRQIDLLAENNDWLAMHDLVEKRMICLNKLFDAVNLDTGRQLDVTEQVKLAEIADSNQRILDLAKGRQEEIISFSATRRVGLAAQQAYSS